MEELYCRVCNSSGCRRLNEPLGDSSIICALITITGVQMSLNDSLPQHICSSCLFRLTEAITLRSMCITTDYELRQAESRIDKNTQKNNFQQLMQQIEHQLSGTTKTEKNKTQKRVKTVKTVKKDKVKKKKERSFKCDPCSLTFSSKEQLKTHRSARQCSRHPCHVCGQLVVSLPQHVRATHGGTQYECHVCGKKFPISARLRSHQRVHEDNFGFECAHCEYKSKHKYYLVLHMRTHTGERPHVCACGAAFINPSNLNKHRLTHRDRQFPCSLCDKVFRLSSTLREHHESAHMRVKHTCTVCGRDFSYKSDLRKHEIRAHNRAKRVGGGEPTYKQLERLRRETRDSGATETGAGGIERNNGIESVVANAPWRLAQLQDVRNATGDCSTETESSGHLVDVVTAPIIAQDSCPTPAFNFKVPTLLVRPLLTNACIDASFVGDTYISPSLSSTISVNTEMVDDALVTPHQLPSAPSTQF